MALSNSKSIAGKPLPPPTTMEGITTILFYQYVEPVWSARRLKQTLAEVARLGREFNVTGRGREVQAVGWLKAVLKAPPQVHRSKPLHEDPQGFKRWFEKL